MDIYLLMRNICRIPLSKLKVGLQTILWPNHLFSLTEDLRLSSYHLGVLTKHLLWRRSTIKDVNDLTLSVWHWMDFGLNQKPPPPDRKMVLLNMLTYRVSRQMRHI